MSVVERGYEEAQRITLGRAKSFSFAARALPKETRRHAFAVYAFCRRCDDAVDTAATREAAEGGVAALRTSLDLAYDTGRAVTSIADPVLSAFADTVRSRHVPRSAFDDLLLGMAEDVGLKQLETWDELDRYCQLAAGTVGIMMASIFGVSLPSALTEAAALGRAMQLTNILRDVGEDVLQHDRVYLPRVALEEAGVTRSDLVRFAQNRRLDGSPAGLGLKRVMRFAAHRARRLYAQADLGVPLLATPTARACVRLMRATYSEIVNVIEAADWDVFAERRHTRGIDKVRVGARALLVLPFAPFEGDESRP